MVSPINLYPQMSLKQRIYNSVQALARQVSASPSPEYITSLPVAGGRSSSEESPGDESPGEESPARRSPGGGSARRRSATRGSRGRGGTGRGGAYRRSSSGDMENIY